jgi:hypothetical protein
MLAATRPSEDGTAAGSDQFRFVDPDSDREELSGTDRGENFGRPRAQEADAALSEIPLTTRDGAIGKSGPERTQNCRAMANFFLSK